MQTTHEKAIKYLGIATIVLAAFTLLACLIGMVGMGALSAYTQSAYPVMDYGHGYGHHGMMTGGSYSDVAGFTLVAGIANALMFWKLACAAVALIAGIMAVRLNNPSAHGLRTVFIWALVAAICSLLAGSLITMTLLIIIAVFAEMDRRALEGGAPAAKPVAAAAASAPTNAAYAAAYGEDVAPAAPVPAATAATAETSVAPAEPQAPAPVAAVPVEAPATPTPAVAENQAIAEEAAAAVAVHEAEAEAVVEGAPTDDIQADVAPIDDAQAEATQAAAAVEEVHIAEEGQAAADFYQDNANAVANVANTVTETSIEDEATTPAVMESEGQAEELKADETMTKEQDSPEQL